jgi:hypothetical protein
VSTSFRSTSGSDGILEADGLIIGGASFPLSKGTTYHVDAVDGSDSNTGLTWDKPFLTMSKAFTTIGSGDTIIFVGKVREQLTTPVQVFDVTVIGGGNRPRHADAAPVPTGGESANTWTIPASGATTAPLVTVLQQGWRFVNVLFAGPTDDSCVNLFRNSASGNSERDSSHASFYNCRFASGQDGIESEGGAYNVGIFDCSFHDLTGHALKHTSAGVANPYRWQVKGNRFQECANWMGAWATHAWEITDNVISEITTALVDVSGGAGANVIIRNAFDIAAADFDPAGGVTGHATDVWSNYLTDAIETGLPTN